MGHGGGVADQAFDATQAFGHGEPAQLFAEGIGLFLAGVEAHRQMRAGGAIMTVSFNAIQYQTNAFCKQLRWFTMAESLGGIESLICHPATMTHAAVSAEVKAKLGIDDGLVRFSVGCEDLADLQADLDQALELLLSSHYS